MTPHRKYRLLGTTGEERQQAYRALFRGRMPERELTDIREATNKAWALGDTIQEKNRGKDRANGCFLGTRKGRQVREVPKD